MQINVKLLVYNIQNSTFPVKIKTSFPEFFPITSDRNGKLIFNFT